MIYGHPVFGKLHLCCNSKWIAGVAPRVGKFIPLPSPYLMVYDHPCSLISPSLLTCEKIILGVPKMTTVFSLARNGLWFKKKHKKFLNSYWNWSRPKGTDNEMWYFCVLSQYFFKTIKIENKYLPIGTPLKYWILKHQLYIEYWNTNIIEYWNTIVNIEKLWFESLERLVYIYLKAPLF